MNIHAQKSTEVGFICPPCGCGEDKEFHEEAGNCAACGMARFAAIKEGYEPATGSVLNAPSKTVAIFIFPGVQIIDYTGPYEVFGQAGWTVFTVAQSEEVLQTAMGMQVKPHYTFNNAPEADFLLVPGGNVDTSDEQVLQWLKKQVEEKEQTLSVCNGAYFLGAAGILDGKTATTFAPLIPGLKDIAPKANVVSDERFTDNGKILTSAGLSSGIDAAIYLVSKYQGLGNAQRIATHLEYQWSPDKGFVRAQLADMHIQSFGSFIDQFDREWLTYEGDESRWYLEVALDTPLTAAQIRSIIDYQAGKGQHWMKSGDSWNFQVGDDNWNATYQVTTEKNKKIVKLTVEKAG